MGTRGIASPIKKFRVGKTLKNFETTTEALREYFMLNANLNTKPARFSELARELDCSIAMPGIIYKKMVMHGEIPAYYEAYRISGPKMIIKKSKAKSKR